jgi:hypothetical protein
MFWGKRAEWLATKPAGKPSVRRLSLKNNLYEQEES